MIAYLDTSAVVPLLIAEPGTVTCQRIWQDADRVVSSRLTVVETGAALAMAHRGGRITADEETHAWINFQSLWPEVDVVELDAELATTAATMATTLALRGYDAVHCASAAQLDDPELVGVAGDARLLQAWRSLGVATLDTRPQDWTA